MSDSNEPVDPRILMREVVETVPFSKKTLDRVTRILESSLPKAMEEADGKLIKPFDSLSLVFANSLVDASTVDDRLIAVVDDCLSVEDVVAPLRVRYPKATFNIVEFWKGSFILIITIPPTSGR